MKYLYESDGVVKAYPEKKPKYAHYVHIVAGEIIDSVEVDIKYDNAFKEWEASGKIVDSTQYIWSEGKLMFNFKLKNGECNGWQEVKNGQQVETEPSGDNVIVTKII